MKLDAAIKILQNSIIRLRAFKVKPKDIEIAIRVLEAAGKVDKSKLRLDDFTIILLTPEIRALFDSLPEPGKEKK